MSENPFQKDRSDAPANYLNQISEAMAQLELVYKDNPESRKPICDRINRLFHIIKYPQTTLPDGSQIQNAESDLQDNSNGSNTALFPNQTDKIAKRASKNPSDPKSFKPCKLPPDVTQRNANELERKRVEDRLNGFNMRTSPAWREICRRFGPSLNQTELLSLAQIIAGQLGLKVDREAKRRKEVLIKWYDENLKAVMEILPYIVLEDGDGNAVVGDEGRDFSNGMIPRPMMNPI